MRVAWNSCEVAHGSADYCKNGCLQSSPLLQTERNNQGKKLLPGTTQTIKADCFYSISLKITKQNMFLLINMIRTCFLKIQNKSKA